MSQARRRERELTLSGSSAHTFLPGLALSGNTHSFEGLANTFPADEEVSLLPLPLATGVEDVEAVLGRETIDGRAGIAIFPFVWPLVVMVVRDLIDADGVDVDGRAARLEFVEAFRGRGSATDMPAGYVSYMSDPNGQLE